MTNDASNPVIPLEPDGVQPGFDIVLRGYDRGQVDRQISWLEEQLGATDRETATLTEALRRAEHDAAQARRQADQAAAELERGRPTFEALGERVSTMLRLAEEEAEALKAAGQTEVDRARAQSAEELAAAHRALAEAHQAAEQQAQAVLGQAREEAQRLITEARRSAAETTSAAQHQVDAMSRQRDAIHAELLRVRERFAAVMGGTIDVTAPRRDPADSSTGSEPATEGETDSTTARTQQMPSEPST